MVAEPDVRAAKAAARLRARRALAELTVEDRATASAAIRNRLLALPEVRSAPRVVSCLSFGPEVDTWPLVAALADAGRAVLAPRAVPGDLTMTLHPYPCALETLRMGLRQPAAAAPALATAELTASDVVLVLGLAFDRRGVRLGHGKGYFDRFLATTAALPIGVCFAAQVVERLPREPHDVAMARVVTEEGLAYGGSPYQAVVKSRTARRAV